MEAQETGKTVLENALIKAKEYSKEIKFPIIAADSALYVKKFKKQPGIYVKRENGKYISEDEIEDHYIEKLNEIGGESIAYYITGLAIIKEIKEDNFILTNKVCNSNKTEDPLSRIEFDIRLNKYFCDITNEDRNNIKNVFDEECVKFIKQVFKL